MLILCHDELPTSLRPTITRMINRNIVIKPVIIRQLLTLLDITDAADPNMTLDDIHLAIRIARMIQITRAIPLHTSINMVTLVQLKQIEIARLILLVRNNISLLLRHLRANILDDPRPIRNILLRKRTIPLLRGLPHCEPFHAANKTPLLLFKSIGTFPE